MTSRPGKQSMKERILETADRLFYLRGIAPPSVRSSDIYWGAIPWVILQLLLVAILIAWPGLVTNFLDAEIVVDPNFEIIVPGNGGGDPWFELRFRVTVN